MSNTIFIIGDAGTGQFDPHKLTDEQLQAHIERTFTQLQSISQEWQQIWNHPMKEQEQIILSRQFSALSAELEYANQVWHTRQITMR